MTGRRRGLVLLGTLMAAAACGAQSTELGTDVLEALPQQATAVVDRLATLKQLPDGPWRMHSADLAHGESTELDDSSWAVAKAGENYPGTGLWFRRWIVVPKTLSGYDLTGTRIWFSLDIRPLAHGAVTEIVYFDGRRVALGENLEQLVLFDCAKPGDRLLVAVKLLPSLERFRFEGLTERIDIASGRPNPQDLHDELVSTEQLLPSFSANPAHDRATLLRAISQVDLAALDAGDQARFDASLQAATTSLSALLPVVRQAKVTLTGNSHIDAAWLWPRSETIDVVKRTFSTALQLMDEYPGYTYTQSAAQYNEWLADKYPALNEEIKQRIREGRWEVVGGMWVEPDLNIPDGESTARSILLGKRWYQQQYGVDVHVGWNPDSFGYNWQLPQIYKRSGTTFL